jgi:hypothetical protein
MQKTHVCDEDRSVGFYGQLLATPAGTFDRLPVREYEAVLPALKAVPNPNSLMLRRTCFRAPTLQPHVLFATRNTLDDIGNQCSF